MHSKRLPTAGNFAFAIANDNYRGVAGFIHVDSVNARTQDRESQVGSIDLEIFVTIQMPHADAQRALGDLQLNGVVVEVQKRKTSAGSKTNRRGAEMQLCARIVVSPKLVAGGHGPVHHSGDPVVRSRRLKRDRAFGLTEASYAAGGIILVSGGALRDRNVSKQSCLQT